MRNQNGFGVVEIVIVIAVVAMLGIGAFMVLGRSDNKPTGSSQTSVEGQVTQIVDQGGETCLTYVVNTSDYIAVQCPDMAGFKGFSGEYDKNIKVGDKVTAQGTPKSAKRADRTTYHLDTPSSYLRLAE